MFSRGAILPSMGFRPDTTRSWHSSPLIRGGSLTVLAISLLAATFSWAGNVLQIGSLLAKPELYQLETVRVTGVVSDNPRVRHIKGNKCAEFFTVKDETGSIRAVHGVRCSGAVGLLRKRDTVTVEARLERTAGGAGLLNVQAMLAKVVPYP